MLTITNSRAPGSSRVSLIAPRGRGVAPGSPKNVKDFWTLIHKVYEQSGATSPAQVAPAPPVLRSIMGRLLEPGAVPRSVQLSRKTAMLFSRMSDTWLTPVDRLRLSVLVGLVSMEEITDYTGLSRTKATAIFKLAPILAAQ